MNSELYTLRQEFRVFANTHIDPNANEWDDKGEIPNTFIDLLGRHGYLCGLLPQNFGGQNWSCQTMGLLHEAFGRSSSSLTVILTVQWMVAKTILKWGTQTQQEKWLPGITSGKCLAAYALTEPQAGSDLNGIKTTLTKTSTHWVLQGNKKWITYGKKAGLFLVFAKAKDQPIAVLVPAELPGIHIRPVSGMMGFRSAGIAEITFENVTIPSENIVGKLGMGFTMVAPYGLHFGRMSTAFSSLGLIRACLEISSQYATKRHISSEALAEKSLIRSLIAQMGVHYDAAWHLCHAAAQEEDNGNYMAIEKALAAKHFSSTTACSAAHTMGQILGAVAVQQDLPAERYFRDSRIMEIIEGSTHTLELLLGRVYIDKFAKSI